MTDETSRVSEKAVEARRAILTQIALWSDDEGLELSIGQGDDLVRRIMALPSIRSASSPIPAAPVQSEGVALAEELDGLAEVFLDEDRHSYASIVNKAAIFLRISPQPVEPAPGDTHAFKNFHRLLCERFDYCHDEKDWRRDQVSLIEHIARKVEPTPGAGAKRWLIEEHLPSGSIRWSCVEHQHHANELAKLSEHRTTVSPLYSAPGAGEAEKWHRACAAQSRKLQAVLHIPGVKEAINELTWSDWQTGAGEDAEREAGLVGLLQEARKSMYDWDDTEFVARVDEALSRTRHPTEPKPAQGMGESK